MLELRILTGISQGAAFPLVDDEWLIGSSDEADIVLMDPLIQANHCRLKKNGDEWTLTSEQGKVLNKQGQAVDSIDNLPLGTAFALNQTWMVIADVNTPWETDKDDNNDSQTAQTEPTNSESSSKTRKIQITTFIFGFVTAVAITVSSAWASFNKPSPKESHNITKQHQVSLDSLGNAGLEKQSIAGSDSQKNFLPVLKNSQQVSQTLNYMIRQRELDDQIHTNIHDNKVVLTGQVKASDLPVVQRMMARFQSQYQTKVAVLDNITDHHPKLPFTIDQIEGGKLGSVVLENGQRLFVGDEVDGLRLMSINDDNVVFSGKQQHYEVKW